MSEHSDDIDDVALERLILQASIFEPVTIRHLETIGVSEGWKCLEVGAGTGSVAQWFAARVGPSGKVMATDVDLSYLSRTSAPNLEIRRHDILNDDLDEDTYDVVHCRFLLEHLSDPEKALRRMAEAVRPGGWLLLEEHDWASMLSMDVTDPSLTPLATAFRGLFDFLRSKGIADMYIGRRVRGLVEQLEFMDVGQEGSTFIARGGEPLARVHGMSIQIVLARGLLTKEQADTYQRLYRDPAFRYPAETMFSAWARKPVSEGRT